MVNSLQVNCILSMIQCGTKTFNSFAYVKKLCLLDYVNHMVFIEHHSLCSKLTYAAGVCSQAA